MIHKGEIKPEFICGSMTEKLYGTQYTKYYTSVKTKNSSYLVVNHTRRRTNGQRYRQKQIYLMSMF